MEQKDELKGDLRLRWFQDGRFIFDLPTDAMIAYAMLHVAMDEIQERMMGVKAQHARKQRLLTVPNDGNHKPQEWGK